MISLFAGAGGSSLGYSAAGFDERLAVDQDKLAAATFSLNFPGVAMWCEDIRQLSADDVLLYPSESARVDWLWVGTVGYPSVGTRAKAPKRATSYSTVEHKLA